MAGQNPAEKHLDATVNAPTGATLTRDNVPVTLGDMKQLNARSAANGRGDQLHDVPIYGTQAGQTYNKADDSTHYTDSQGTEVVGYGQPHGPGAKYDHGFDKGYTRDKNGNEHHWGLAKGDNYDINNFKAPDGTVTRTMTEGLPPHNMISKDTDNPDGSKRHDYGDKTGYTEDKYGNEHHWGPKAKDNYEARTEADKTRVKTFKDGSKEFDSPDGKKFQNEDGSKGYTVDKNGEEHHWGPKDSDNYTQKTVDGKHVRSGYKDHHFETDLPNGKTQILTSDDGNVYNPAQYIKTQKIAAGYVAGDQ